MHCNNAKCVVPITSSLESSVSDHLLHRFLIWEHTNTLHQVLVGLTVFGDNPADLGNNAEGKLVIHLLDDWQAHFTELHAHESVRTPAGHNVSVEGSKRQIKPHAKS